MVTVRPTKKYPVFVIHSDTSRIHALRGVGTPPDPDRLLVESECRGRRQIGAGEKKGLS